MKIIILGAGQVGGAIVRNDQVGITFFSTTVLPVGGFYYLPRSQNATIQH